MSNAITVTVNDKDFILYSALIGYTGQVYFNYRSTRDGEAFGPVRTASLGKGSPKSVGFQLAAAGRDAFGEAAIEAARARKIVQVQKRIAEVDPTSRWAESDLAHLQQELANLEGM